MVGIGLKLIGLDKLNKKLKSGFVSDAKNKSISRIALKLERLVKMATVVKTGRLRSSILKTVHSGWATVGTNVEYAPRIEYGAGKMVSRHMEGTRKILGQGMFSYGLSQLDDGLTDDERELAKDIEVRFEYGS